MSEETDARAALAASQPPTSAHCQWCSAELADPTPERCPSCGARLVEETAAEIPGVTTVDPAVLRAVAAQPVKRGMFGMSGTPRETPLAPEVADVVPSSLDALAPPSRAVLEEMRRLRDELDAAAAHAQAEADADADADAEAERLATEPAAGGPEAGATDAGSQPRAPEDGAHDARPGGG